MKKEEILTTLLILAFILFGLVWTAQGQIILPVDPHIPFKHAVGYLGDTQGAEWIPDKVDLEIIKQIESGGNPRAYNKRSGATGMYQITYICLEDFNRFAHPITIPISYLRMDDMYSPLLSREVANWYMNTRIPQLLKHFGRKDTLENRLISYNCGVGCVGKKLPKETRKYLRKYRRLNHDRTRNSRPSRKT